MVVLAEAQTMFLLYDLDRCSAFLPCTDAYKNLPISIGQIPNGI